MGRVFYIILFSVTSFFFACNDNKEQEEKALDIYNVAYEYYLSSNLDSASVFLDSLQSVYPALDKTNYLSKMLRQSIARDRSMSSIDSLSQMINEYKIEKIKLESNKAKKEDIDLIDKKIDSLEQQKAPFRDIYNNIRAMELTECKQCVTYMRNRRK